MVAVDLAAGYHLVELPVNQSLLLLRKNPHSHLHNRSAHGDSPAVAVNVVMSQCQFFADVAKSTDLPVYKPIPLSRAEPVLHRHAADWSDSDITVLVPLNLHKLLFSRLRSKAV